MLWCKCNSLSHYYEEEELHLTDVSVVTYSLIISNKWYPFSNVWVGKPTACGFLQRQKYHSYAKGVIWLLLCKTAFCHNGWLRKVVQFYRMENGFLSSFLLSLPYLTIFGIMKNLPSCLLIHTMGALAYIISQTFTHIIRDLRDGRERDR